ncbi:hypothetical protein J27TS8_37290 [Robertmurraya siralis]|uniref:Uncharacterized protein n=1 Tax=Robertmurraya siralis TaxID=77777 RepID=A0A919WL64_9BACI|nr:hypothetical protein J27TS8_37290 [Robertmurraya siralis]
MKKNKEGAEPRFKIANREAVIGIILVIINFGGLLLLMEWDLDLLQTIPMLWDCPLVFL